MDGMTARHRATNRRGAMGYIVTHNETETARAKAQLAAYCDLQRLDLQGVLVDHANSPNGAARSLMERAGGSEILNALMAKGDRRHLVVRRLDDLGTVHDFQQLLGNMGKRWRYLHVIKRGLTTEMGDATGKLLTELVADVSRMVANQLKAVATNSLPIPRLTGSVPYGWNRLGKHLVPNPHQQEVRKMATGWRQSGMTLRKVAAKLNEAGERTAQGRFWNYRSVDSLKYSSNVDDLDSFQGQHIYDKNFAEYLRRGEVLDMLKALPEAQAILAKVEAEQRALAEKRWLHAEYIRDQSGD